MKSYIYNCTNCKSEFEAKNIENDFHYLCPSCGNAEKNRPLKGVLQIDYDYDSIQNRISREDFLNLEAGKFWLFPELWPIDFSRIDHLLLEKLVLPSNTLLNFQLGVYKFSILDETRNPTLSFKDRASSLVVLKALEMGIQEIAAASTGNAGSSLAGICARLGLISHIYVPKNIPDAKRIQIEAYGANLVVVDGDYDLAFDKCLEDSMNNNWFNRNTAYNPLTMEGKKSAAFDIFIQTKGKLPDVIFVPVGDGVIISGIYKGFRELLLLGWIEIIPQLIGVQSEKSNAIVRYIKTDQFEYKPANTIADSISAGAPRNLYFASEAIKNSKGLAIAVTDEEILTSQKEFIKMTGVLCEPSSGAAYAGYKKLFNDGFLQNKSILLLITGNGLKDIEQLNNEKHISTK